MKRLVLTIACFSLAAWAQASAEGLSSDPLKSPRPHAAKAKHPAATKAASLDNEIHFSDPYAPPDGTTVVRKSGGIPGYSYPIPKEPHGGLSISMGQDGGGHTTGGLSWGF
jgi:hypothetical protein